MKLLLISALALAYVCPGQRHQGVQTARPAEVFSRFCELDSQGGQLTPDGWQKIAALFANPGTPRYQRVIVSDGGGPLRPTLETGKIAVGREYIEYGQIDLPQLRFSALNGLPAGVKVRSGAYVASVSGAVGAEQWRIEGPVPDPVVSVGAAILYVAKLGADAKDPVIKRNAERTLAALKHFR